MRKRSILRRQLNQKLPVKNQTPVAKKRIFSKDKLVIFGILIGIFCLVMFFNSYFNFLYSGVYNPAGDTLGTRFYLSGPDPYYNMRLIQETLRTGSYPFMITGDPLLNYPMGLYDSARPPVFNLVAIGSTLVLQNFMSQIDALGFSMLFLPAIYGALLVFPVYGIGKELFNKKVGLIAALFIALIPIHLSAGHGSALSLFDHDSFLLLFFNVTFYLLIRSFKDTSKKGYIFAILAGLSIAVVQMTWASAELIFVTITLVIAVKFVIDVLRKDLNPSNAIKVSILFGTNFLVCLPYQNYISATGYSTIFNIPFYMLLVSLAIVGLYYVYKKANLPWLVSLPSTFALTMVGLFFLYLVYNGTFSMRSSPLWGLSNIIFGSGIYGLKVSATIGEAHVFGLSQTVMSFGPSLYFLGIIGFIMFLYKTLKEKFKTEQILLISVFIVNFYLTTQAGRFLNDLLPQIAIFSAFIVWMLVDKLNFKNMAKNIKAVGGLRGIKKGVKFTHVFGVLFVVFVVLVPNVYCALDAAVPPSKKAEFFGDNYVGAWGLSPGQSAYWADAMRWLSEQDTNISEPAKRPGILTWWDYGFYISSMGEHPTVADNYQDGIPPAANFHIAQSEDEAIAILIIRIAEATKTKGFYKAKMTSDVEDIFKLYLPDYNETKTENNITFEITNKPSEDAINIMEDPEKYAPSYNQLIAPEWNNTVLKTDTFNAMYHDVTKILLKNLNDEQLVMMYKDIRNATGYSILYYGVEYRDLVDIFAVFPFLADKGVHGYVTAEDDFYKTVYVDSKTNIEYTIPELNNLTAKQIQDMSLSPKTITKDAYYNSMAYKTYYGISENQRVPTYGLRHFRPIYVSPYVIIAKYYEGAIITGNVFVGNESYFGAGVVILDEFQIPHDSSYVMPDGSFRLLAPSGNVSIVVVKDNNLIKTVNIETPISEEESTRAIDLARNIQIKVNESYADFIVTGVNESGLTLKITGPRGDIITPGIENKTYHFVSLVPSEYQIVVTNETGSIFYSDSVFINPNENFYNLSLSD